MYQLIYSFKSNCNVPGMTRNLGGVARRGFLSEISAIHAPCNLGYAAKFGGSILPSVKWK